MTEKSDVQVVKINAGDKFGPKILRILSSGKNLLVLVDASFKSEFKI
jgi:hypothetical protein